MTACFYLRLDDTNEGTENDEKVVSDLRSELWEKERKLTDIRLEALTSAHQLEQLQDAMSKMQVCEERQNTPPAPCMYYTSKYRTAVNVA